MRRLLSERWDILISLLHACLFDCETFMGEQICYRPVRRVISSNFISCLSFFYCLLAFLASKITFAYLDSFHVQCPVCSMLCCFYYILFLQIELRHFVRHFMTLETSKMKRMRRGVFRCERGRRFLAIRIERFERSTSTSLDLLVV